MSHNHTPSSSNTARYGSWSSEINAQRIVSDSVSIDETRQTENTLYYIERRPQDAGRCVIVRITNDESTDMLSAPYSARSRVHEYGGGCYCVHEDTVYFINDSDQDIYAIKDQQISRITSVEDKRFADFSYDKKHHRLIAICETHIKSNVINSIVSIDISNGYISDIEINNDFYASPRLNSSASQLCWQTWNHPDMPWDGNQLWLADINEHGQLQNKKHIAGANDISVFQPQWSPADVLHFISDDSGWWHLYRYTVKNDTSNIEQLSHGEKEFGLPQWVFAQSTYAFINNTDIICCYQTAGKTILATFLLAEQNELLTLDTNWQEFHSISADAGNIAFIAASDHSFSQLVSASFDSNNSSISTTVVKTSSALTVTTEYYSTAKTISFSNRHRQTVFANYYPPKNPNYQVNDNKPPPLIVICHGGPTGQSGIALDARKQYWTSRGFALLDVNYSGSTGYGRQYRQRLEKNWGKLDVTDCCDAALYAVSQGLANKDQLIIRGSSAGGFTVLAALTFEQVFSAGASYYGISELTSLARDTHKFESRYLDRLIGPYPETEDIYRQRSPINHSDQLNCPVIFFQGIEDKVVPKEQAEQMIAALTKKGIAVASRFFAAEQHGFRKAETIIDTLENELYFYANIFDFDNKDGQAVEIHNFKYKKIDSTETTTAGDNK